MQTNEQLRRWQSPAGCLELHHRSSKKHWGVSGQQEAISNAILVVQEDGDADRPCASTGMVNSKAKVLGAAAELDLVNVVADELEVGDTGEKGLVASQAGRCSRIQHDSIRPFGSELVDQQVGHHRGSILDGGALVRIGRRTERSCLWWRACAGPMARSTAAYALRCTRSSGLGL